MRPHSSRPVEAAVDAGIVVLTVANNLADTSALTAQITSDDNANGRAAAELMGELTAGRTGKVGSTITDARQDGFEAGLAEYPNLEYVGATVISGFAPEDGARAASAILAAHPDLIGIVGGYLDISTGVATTIAERGLEEQVVALQLDSDERGVENVREGALDGLTGDNVYQQGFDAVEQVNRVFTGETVEERISVPPVRFTQENVDDPALQPVIQRATCQ
jgi:ABC-type sugar transport system substrate-binding protein